MVGTYLDPSSGDYVVEAGAIRQDATAATRVYLALATRRGAFFARPELGSRLHQLIDRDVPGREELAREYALEALRPQVADGLLVDLQVVVERDPRVRGRLNLLVRARDGLTGQAVIVQVPVR
jgi:phage gp46-like protein